MLALFKRFYNSFAPSMIKVELFQIGSVTKGFCVLTYLSSMKVLDPQDLKFKWRKLTINETGDKKTL